MNPDLAFVFTDSCARRLAQSCSRIAHCLELLNEEQVWVRGSENENAIGNLLLHLAGNVRQWILAGLGGKPDVRVREREFSARGDIAKADLLERLQTTVDDALVVIRKLDGEALARTVKIQSYQVTALEAVLHVVEHFALHTGQIIFATKMLTHADLGFYKHLNQPSHQEKTP
ncbi:MAG: DUF1572 domain-containing protein [Bryobacteraceae bacterium]|nr:DUF1572 domain-containing protein [Bryobacteraceae bacterium]MDW8380389.1 DinB family protein [Bryobacterales bacterium]